MQFELNHNIGQQTVIVQFQSLKTNRYVWQALQKVFEKLGGKLLGFPDYGIDNWEFPSFITSQVIQEIIHNTCFVCGGLMGDSTAIQNESLRVKTSQGEIHYPDGNNTKVIKVRKCQTCGHSHT